jgi:hypothetical protein
MRGYPQHTLRTARYHKTTQQDKLYREPWQDNEWSAEWPTAAAMSRLFEVKITPERTNSESRCSILQCEKRDFVNKLK